MFKLLTGDARLPARLMAEFFVAFVVLGCLLFFVLAPIQEWGSANCPARPSVACSFAHTIVAYWPIGAAPLFFLIAYGIHKAYSAFGPKRKDAPAHTGNSHSTLALVLKVLLLLVLVAINVIWILT
jgi:hypothetical protein